MVKLNKYFYYIIGYIFLAAVVSIPLALQIERKTQKSHNNYLGYYAESIVKDGDLNVINQVPREMQWLVTKTYNSPDTESYAAAVLWVIPYFYANIMDHLVIKPYHCFLNNYDGVQIVSALIYTAVSFILGFLILQVLGCSKKLSILILAGIGWGTPLWWNVLIEPSGGAVLGNFSLTLAMWLLIGSSTGYRENNYFWIGIGSLFAFTSIVQSNLLLYLLIPIAWIFLQEQKTVKWKKISLICLGIFCVAVFHFLNLWVKFGDLSSYYHQMAIERAQFFNTKFLLSYDLFGPNGILVVAPLYFLGLSGFALAIFNCFELNKQNDFMTRFVATLGTILFIGMMLSSMNLRYIVEIGGQFFVSQQIVMIIGTHYLFSEIKTKVVKIIVISFAAIATIWSVLYLLRFFSHPETFGNFFLPVNKDFFRVIVQTLYDYGVLVLDKMPKLMVVFLIWLPILLFYQWVFTIIVKKRKLLLVFIIPIIFISISLLNVINTSKNIESLMSSGFFQDKVRGENSYIYRYDDVMAHLDNLQIWAEPRKKSEMIERINDYRKFFTDRARLEIIRPSFWSLKITHPTDECNTAPP